MRPVRTGLAAAVLTLVLAQSAAAQPPGPVNSVPPNQLYERYPGAPLGYPWSVSPNTGTLTGGGFDAQLGYWVRGGYSDSPTGIWPGPAVAPYATAYNLSHPNGTGFAVGPETRPAPGGPYTYTLHLPSPVRNMVHKHCCK
ncbi:MAG: hypothetical protein K2P78_09020 [Gemmataceae bacterium]|nr:hypothetical protein [Gemmataceae bacterium]